MDIPRIVAILVIVAGTLGLVYGGFTYTKETHHADLGPIQMTFDEKERVNVPVWAGVGAIVIGGFLLLAAKKS